MRRILIYKYYIIVDYIIKLIIKLLLTLAYYLSLNLHFSYYFRNRVLNLYAKLDLDEDKLLLSIQSE